MDAVIQILNLVIAGTATAERLVALRDQVRTMKAEGREPTSEEWDALLANVTDNSAALDADDKRLQGE